MNHSLEPEGKSRGGSRLHDGFCDSLEPVLPLDLSKCKDIDMLTKAMSSTAFGGRALGEAVDVFYAMVTDPDCFVVLTVSGAMTVAKMGLVICDMMERGLVHAMVSTGALMAHGFVEATGKLHFKYNKNMNDKELYYAGYDRVYDTLELEKNLILAYVGNRESLASVKDIIHSQQLSYSNAEKLSVLHELKNLALDMKHSLLRNDLVSFGENMGKAWELKKKLNPSVTNQRIDDIYSMARKFGAIGGRIIGAGGGGHMLFYCDSNKEQQVASRLQEAGIGVVDFSFTNNGLETWEANQ